MYATPVITRRCGVDAVVRLVLRLVAVLPAPPRLEPAEDEDQDQDRVRRQDRQPEQQHEADDPERGVDRRDDAAAVERRDRRQVEEVEEEAGERERDEQVGVERTRRAPTSRAAPRPPMIGPAIATFASFQASSGSCLSVIRAPRKGMNIGADTGRPCRFASSDVAQLVDEEQQDEADRELPAPEERVGADRDEHRGGDREELELEDRDEDELQLPDQERRAPRSAPRACAGRRRAWSGA